MKACGYCGEDNREGSLVCRSCGKLLRQTLSVIHVLHEIKNKPQLPPPPTRPELTLMILISQGVKPLTLPYGERVTLGRFDPESQLNHIDLDLFDALKSGVSRIHAAIEYMPEGPTLTDLKSTNGTYFNGERLETHETQILRYGDEVRLGKLVMYIYTQ